MIGTLTNVVAVVLGGSIGLIINKGMPIRLKIIYFQAIGLITFALGISMVYNLQHFIVIAASLILGSLIGEWIDIESYSEKLLQKIKVRFNISNNQFSEGLTTAFLLFCIGPMTILGAINEGSLGDSTVLLTKSLLDFFSALLLASALGIGVVFSALPLFIFQASITLLADYSASFFNKDIISGIKSIGGILIIGLSINILEIKKIRIMNMLPSLIIVVIIIITLAKFNIKPF